MNCSSILSGQLDQTATALPKQPDLGPSISPDLPPGKQFSCFNMLEASE